MYQSEQICGACKGSRAACQWECEGRHSSTLFQQDTGHILKVTHAYLHNWEYKGKKRKKGGMLE